MSDFKPIEKSDPDYKKLYDCLEQVNSEALAVVSSDGVLDQADIIECLDTNFDGNLNTFDFDCPIYTQVPALFNEMEAILGRHGYQLFPEITYWEYSVKIFVETGNAFEPGLLTSSSFMAEVENLQDEYEALAIRLLNKDPEIFFSQYFDQCRYLPAELLEGHQSRIEEEVDGDFNLVMVLPEAFLLNHPEIAVNAMELATESPDDVDQDFLGNEISFYIPEQIQLDHPDIVFDLLAEKGCFLGMSPQLYDLYPTQYEESLFWSLGIQPASGMLDPDWSVDEIHAAVKKDHTFVLKLPKEFLLQHPEIAITAMKSAAESSEEAIQFFGYNHNIPEEIQLGYPEVVFDLLASKGCFEGVSPELYSQYPEEYEAAVLDWLDVDPNSPDTNPTWIRKAPIDFQMNHPEYFDRLLTNAAFSTIYFIDPRVLSANPELFERAVELHPESLGEIYYLGNEWRRGLNFRPIYRYFGIDNHEEFITELALVNPEGFRYIPDDGLQNDILERERNTLIADGYPDWALTDISTFRDYFQALSVVDCFQVFENIPQKKQDCCWEMVRKILDQRQIEFPESAMKSYADFTEYLGTLTNYPNHFRSFEMINDLLLKGYDPSDSRPVVLVLVAKEDWNGSGLREVDDMFKYYESPDFQLVYAEIESDEEEVAIGLDILRRSGKNQGAIFGLIREAHGSQTGLLYGDYRSKEEKIRATIDDIGRCDDSTQAGKLCVWSQIMQSGGFIYNAGCSNGEGKEGADNFHNAEAEAIPQVVHYSHVDISGHASFEIDPETGYPIPRYTAYEYVLDDQGNRIYDDEKGEYMTRVKGKPGEGEVYVTPAQLRKEGRAQLRNIRLNFNLDL